jgi:hypothetical protein
MNYLQKTIEKINEVKSLNELSKIKFAVNYPALNWSENDKIILNSIIEDTEVFLKVSPCVSL